MILMILIEKYCIIPEAMYNEEEVYEGRKWMNEKWRSDNNEMIVMILMI